MGIRRVVVTGIGTINPLGNDVAEFFANLEKGVSGAAPITHFDAGKFKTRFACEIKNYDWTRYFDRKEVRKYDLFAQYALVAVAEALRDSGFSVENSDAERAGVIWSTGVGGLTSFFEEVTDYAGGDGTPRFSPFFIPRMIPDLAAGYISIKYGFKGPNYCVSSACASSNHGLISALDQIRTGRADVMIAGGSEAVVNIPGVGGFNSMQAISTRNDDPQHASRPFDVARDGFVMGEGAAALVLEEYEHAKARGAKIYSEFAGGGMSADAYHMTAPDPEGNGAVKSMKDALAEAGLSPAQVDYVNVHGTSTPLGDVAELKAMHKVFGEDIYNVNISSTKSMTGHLLGAAAAVEALACIFAIEKGIVPPTINVEEVDPAIDPKLNLTLNKAQKRDVRTAMSNTFGFGGHNSTVVFRKL
ncbi:MAG TPA: beta-ketoacyl-ACP synthase II [Candidatus Alistipes excrementipullorum]|nr:beta-ketoacyl-ACP synthase II [Candidatus Alistipes excrementipullorum]